MIDREGERWLWTGESADCVNCGHSLQHHWTLDNGKGFCTKCADSNNGNQFYHQFFSNRNRGSYVHDKAKVQEASR